MYKVLIGIPSGGALRPEMVTSLFGAVEVIKSHGVEIGLSMQVGGYVARNRNQIVEESFKHECTHIMFVDNDMVFPASGIQRLIDHDKDIVLGNYNARGVTNQPVISTIKLLDEKGKFVRDGSSKTVVFPPTLFKVAAGGTGFMLIKTSVFAKLDKPYFIAYEEKSGEHHTEDVEFCINARKAGFDIWCSPTIEIGHIGTKQY